MLLNMASAQPNRVFKINLQLPYYIVVRLLGMWLHIHACVCVCVCVGGGGGGGGQRPSPVYMQ